MGVTASAAEASQDDRPDLDETRRPFILGWRIPRSAGPGRRGGVSGGHRNGPNHSRAGGVVRAHKGHSSHVWEECAPSWPRTHKIWCAQQASRTPPRGLPRPSRGQRPEPPDHAHPAAQIVSLCSPGSELRARKQLRGRATATKPCSHTTPSKIRYPSQADRPAGGLPAPQVGLRPELRGCPLQRLGETQALRADRQIQRTRSAPTSMRLPRRHTASSKHQSRPRTDHLVRQSWLAWGAGHAVRIGTAATRTPPAHLGRAKPHAFLWGGMMRSVGVLAAMVAASVSRGTMRVTLDGRARRAPV